MDLILQTERLLLRPLELSDTADFFAMNDNPNVNRYLRKPLSTETEAWQYIQNIIGEYEQNGIGRFAVVLKENDKLIGMSGLKFRSTLENNYTDIYDLGYRFAEEHWRKGFAIEAAQAWLNHGFNTMDLPVIHACAVRDNVGSNAVLRKLGFEFTNEYTAIGLPHNWYRFDKQNFK